MIGALDPLRMNLSPSRLAEVANEAASEKKPFLRFMTTYIMSDRVGIPWTGKREETEPDGSSDENANPSS